MISERKCPKQTHCEEYHPRTGRIMKRRVDECIYWRWNITPPMCLNPHLRLSLEKEKIEKKK